MLGGFSKNDLKCLKDLQLQLAKVERILTPSKKDQIFSVPTAALTLMALHGIWNKTELFNRASDPTSWGVDGGNLHFPNPVISGKDGLGLWLGGGLLVANSIYPSELKIADSKSKHAVKKIFEDIICIDNMKERLNENEMGKEIISGLRLLSEDRIHNDSVATLLMKCKGLRDNIEKILTEQRI